MHGEQYVYFYFHFLHPIKVHKIIIKCEAKKYICLDYMKYMEKLMTYLGYTGDTKRFSLLTLLLH